MLMYENLLGLEPETTRRFGDRTVDVPVDRLSANDDGPAIPRAV